MQEYPLPPIGQPILVLDLEHRVSSAAKDGEAGPPMPGSQPCQPMP
jgi:hypothetical protein